MLENVIIRSKKIGRIEAASVEFVCPHSSPLTKIQTHTDYYYTSSILYIEGHAGVFRSLSRRLDFKLGFVRLLNHSYTPNVQIVSGGTATPVWYEGVREPYHLWYECSLVAKRKIRAGAEADHKIRGCSQGSEKGHDRNEEKEA